VTGPLAHGPFETASLGHVAEVTLGKMVQSSPFADASLVPYIKARNVRPEKVDFTSLDLMYATAPERNLLNVREGDIFVIEGGATAGRVAVVTDPPPKDCVFQNAVHRVRAKPSTDQRFIYYVMTAYPGTGWYDALCSAATFKHLTGEKMSGLPVPLPPLDTQRRIADMLDAETARIDTLIEKNERLKNLAELRSRALRDSLTRPRLGEAEVPLRFIMQEVDERVAQAATDLPLLSVSIASGVGRRRTDNHGQTAGENLSNYKICQAEEIVLNRMRAFQGAVGVATETGVVSSDYAVLRLLHGEPRFYHYLMRSDWFVAEMTRRLRGIGGPSSSSVRTPRVNVADLGRIAIPNRSEEDQRAIGLRLDQDAERLERLHEAVRRQLELLRLRRQALITAAVTGEIDV
jgi:type I restriction enzyme S subunit